MAEESYYTPPQAARILQLSRRRVTQMLNDGQLKGEKLDNGRWKIAATVVAQFLSERSARLAPRRGSPSTRTIEELTEQAALLERRVERLADAHNRVFNRFERILDHFERVEQELRERIDKIEEELAHRPQ
jgi:predicted site-specific integrase-resolvase